jgi:hypothetical protein
MLLLTFNYVECHSGAGHYAISVILLNVVAPSLLPFQIFLIPNLQNFFGRIFYFGLTNYEV